MDKVQFSISGACGAAAYGALVSVTPAGLLTGFGCGVTSKSLADRINTYLFSRGPVKKMFSDQIEIEQRDGDTIMRHESEKIFTKDIKLWIAHHIGCAVAMAIVTKISLATGALFYESELLSTKATCQLIVVGSILLNLF